MVDKNYKNWCWQTLHVMKMTNSRCESDEFSALLAYWFRWTDAIGECSIWTGEDRAGGGFSSWRFLAFVNVWRPSATLQALCNLFLNVIRWWINPLSAILSTKSKNGTFIAGFVYVLVVVFFIITNLTQGKVDSTWQSDALPKTHSTWLQWQAWNRFEKCSQWCLQSLLQQESGKDVLHNHIFGLVNWTCKHYTLSLSMTWQPNIIYVMGSTTTTQQPHSNTTTQPPCNTTMARMPCSGNNNDDTHDDANGWQTQQCRWTTTMTDDEDGKWWTQWQAKTANGNICHRRLFGEQGPS